MLFLRLNEIKSTASLTSFNTNLIDMLIVIYSLDHPVLQPGPVHTSTVQLLCELTGCMP